MLGIDRKISRRDEQSNDRGLNRAFASGRGRCTVAAGVFRPLKYQNDHWGSRKRWAGAIATAVKVLLFPPRCMSIML
jgi:hypothetical protein